MKNTNKNNWCVANYKGHISGHDMDEYSARSNASYMNKKYPNEEWEALCGDDEE